MAIMRVANSGDQIKVKPGKEATGGQLTVQLPKPLWINYWGKLFSLGYTNLIVAVSTFLVSKIQIVEIRRNAHRRSFSQDHRWLSTVIRAKGQFFGGQTRGKCWLWGEERIESFDPRNRSRTQGVEAETLPD